MIHGPPSSDSLPFPKADSTPDGQCGLKDERWPEADAGEAQGQARIGIASFKNNFSSANVTAVG